MNRQKGFFGCLLVLLWIGLLFGTACPAISPQEPTAESPTTQEANHEQPSEPSTIGEPKAEGTSPGEPSSDGGFSDQQGTKDGAQGDNAHDVGTLDSPPSDSEFARYTFPASGGQVCYENLCVEAPSGAMPGSSASVFLGKAKNAPPGSLLPPMDVGPDNWKPAGPVFIIFSLAGINLPSGVRPSQLRVAFVSNNRWVYVPTIVDTRLLIARGETTHFSVWGLVISGEDCRSDATCHDREVCTGNVCQAPCTPNTEVCNGIDDDCDGQIDEGCQRCASDADCVAGQQCNAGVCLLACTRGQVRCAGLCVDLQSDTQNCGACGAVCRLGQGCNSGVCGP